LRGFSRRVDKDLEFLSHVIFSDESLFTWEGILNSHNMHKWNDENSRVTRLNQQFPRRRYCLICWSARSLDLNSLDFFLMGTTKKECTGSAFRRRGKIKWQASLCHLVHRVRSYGGNAGKLVETDESLYHIGWRHFEHLLWKK